jgi:hypothetical protein
VGYVIVSFIDCGSDGRCRLWKETQVLPDGYKGVGVWSLCSYPFLFFIQTNSFQETNSDLTEILI